MNKSIEFISDVFIFLVFLCLIVDISNYRIAKENIKDALDLSTKAAALQIDEDPNKISRGTFHIDDTKGKEAFLTVMSKNTNLSKIDVNACMIEYKAINITDNVQVKYLNTADNKEYSINNSTFVALMKFKFKGLLLNKEIILSNNFAGSQLVKGN
jgi:Flp pilus assembly protein TadG